MHVDPDANFKAMGESNRALDAQVRGAGKGDDQRPAAIDKRQVAKNWCKTFGHRWVDYLLPNCANGCGKRLKGRKVAITTTTTTPRRTA